MNLVDQISITSFTVITMLLHNLKNKSGFSFDLEQPENESLNNTINYVLLDVKVQTAHSK